MAHFRQTLFAVRSEMRKAGCSPGSKKRGRQRGLQGLIKAGEKSNDIAIDKICCSGHDGSMEITETPRKKMGGHRPGSGRPPIDPRKRTVTKSITLPRNVWERLAAQGKGSPSQIIKQLISLSEAGAWD